LKEELRNKGIIMTKVKSGEKIKHHVKKENVKERNTREWGNESCVGEGSLVKYVYCSKLCRRRQPCQVSILQ
jgi:hypothetical protein